MSNNTVLDHLRNEIEQDKYNALEEQITDAVKRALVNRNYLIEVNEELPLEKVRVIVKSIGCSIVSYDEVYYICLDAEPDLIKVRQSFLGDNYANIKKRAQVPFLVCLASVMGFVSGVVHVNWISVLVVITALVLSFMLVVPSLLNRRKIPTLTLSIREGTHYFEVA